MPAIELYSKSLLDGNFILFDDLIEGSASAVLFDDPIEGSVSACMILTVNRA